MTELQNSFLEAVIDERHSQDAKWGFPQQATLMEWGSILAEETGELCKELNDAFPSMATTGFALTTADV